jgi:hypothetical protein
MDDRLPARAFPAESTAIADGFAHDPRHRKMAAAAGLKPPIRSLTRFASD